MSLWGTLTGGDARRRADDAVQYNANQLRTGYNNNLGYARDAYGTATGRWGDYDRQGRNALSQYGNFLGLNGQDAQRGAITAYQGYNPYRQAEDDRMLKATDRRAAATGQFGGGMNALARARVADETANRDYTNYLGMLQGQAGMGLGVAGQLAGLDVGYGNQRIGIENNMRQGAINNYTQYANAQAQADQGAFNNIMGLGGMLIGGYNAFNRPQVGGGGANAVGMTGHAGGYNPGPYAGYGLYA